MSVTGRAKAIAKDKYEIEVGDRTLKVSNLDRVLYPETGFTKGQLMDFYEAVSEAMLPHLQGRPLTMRRFTGGVEGSSFWEKRCPDHRPDWVRTEAIWSGSNDEEIDYCVVEDAATLVWAANLASIEMHTSLATAKERQTPRSVVFDLDPGEPGGHPRLCRDRAHDPRHARRIRAGVIRQDLGLEGDAAVCAPQLRDPDLRTDQAVRA